MKFLPFLSTVSALQISHKQEPITLPSQAPVQMPELIQMDASALVASTSDALTDQNICARPFDIEFWKF